MKQYLVTGGAGFIGSHLVRALLEQGGSVRVLDNFSTGKPSNLDGLEAYKRSGRLEVLEGDLIDAVCVAEAVRGMQTVFHEAAFVSVPESMEKPQACFDVNIQGTLILFEAARKASVSRVVIASSAAVYGDSQELPLVEETQLHPLSPYALSKRVNEMSAELYTQKFGLEVTALRYFNVYGPRQRPDTMYAAAVPIFIRQLRQGQPVVIYGDGSQTRDLIYIGDVVKANLIASEHPAAAGATMNVCTGRETRISDLVEILYGLFPAAPHPLYQEPRPGDIYASLGSPAKAQALMGFSAQTLLSDGLKETAAWIS